MARAGEEIYNPVQDDRMVFRKTAQDTDGELLRVELFVSPRGGNPLHVHPNHEEYFKALSGILGVQVGDEYRSLEEGEEALVEAGTPHRWWNDTDQEAHVLVELRPTLNSEIYFQTLYGLARDGKTDENGLPNLLQQAVTLTGVTGARSTSPGHPYRYRRPSWQLSLRWESCSATKTTTRSTAQQRSHRASRELAHRPPRV